MSQLMMGAGVNDETYGVGPCNFADSRATTPYGYPSSRDAWVPFSIRLLSFVVDNTDSYVTGNAFQAQTRVNGAAVGELLTPSPGNRTVYRFIEGSEPIVEGVTAANIDGAARWGVNFPNNDGNGLGTCTWEYEAVDPAHAGKTIMGIGDAVLSDELSAHPLNGDPNFLFAPWSFPKNTIDFFLGGTSTASGYFLTPFETVAQYTAYLHQNHEGERRQPAQIPWCSYGTFQDFMLVFRTEPTGYYEYAFRKNGQTIFSISASAGGNRVWTPVTPVTVNASLGDRYCWQCLASGPAIEGALIWSYKKGAGPGQSGYGELGYGEGGYGTT